MRKLTMLLSLLMVAVVIGLLYGSIRFGAGQTTTSIKGVIDSDTTWAKANSPYTLDGNVLVNNGVTLTIEAGTTINLKAYYIMVNGTLVASGDSVNPIIFQGSNAYNGKIIFTESSVGWNEQTGLGSIIDCASFKCTLVTVEGGSALISNNKYFASQIIVSGGSPKIYSNDIWGGITVGSEVRYFTPVTIDGGSPEIAKNYIHDAETGIVVNQGTPYIYSNNITACHLGIMAISGIIERNYVENPAEIGNATVRSNTIGVITIGNSSPTIMYNNLGYLRLSSSTSVVATNNWWGTTDSAVIDQKIYDFNDDFNLGKVNYKPFLTEANPEAMPDPNAPVPTLNASPLSSPTATASTSPAQTPTTTPQQPGVLFGLGWVEVAIVVLLAVIAVLLAAAVVYLRRRRLSPLPSDIFGSY